MQTLATGHKDTVKTFRVTKSTNSLLVKNKISITKICREAIEKELKKLKDK